MHKNNRYLSLTGCRGLGERLDVCAFEKMVIPHSEEHECVPVPVDPELDILAKDVSGLAGRVLQP